MIFVMWMLVMSVGCAVMAYANFPSVHSCLSSFLGGCCFMLAYVVWKSRRW